MTDEYAQYTVDHVPCTDNVVSFAFYISHLQRLLLCMKYPHSSANGNVNLANEWKIAQNGKLLLSTFAIYDIFSSFQLCL
ncbi:hypothetical protein XELAEV_18002903mg [Xenopus laevis]|nr:hypothetical protein XELAEV_18002903mg [Xenopus laevis]